MAGCQQSYNAPGDVVYSQAQLEGLWINAGGPPQTAGIASAVAMAESRGHSTATCVDGPGSVDRGLWQINSHYHGAYSTYDVPTNVQGAILISNKGADWGQWATFTSGAYRQYMSNIPAPDTSVAVNGTAAAQQNTNPASAQLTSTSNANDMSLLGPLACNPITESISAGFCLFTSPGSFLGSIAQTAIDYALRQILNVVLKPILNYMGGIIGMVAGGGMIIVGVFLVVQDSRTAQQTVRTGVGLAGVATGNVALAGAAPVGSRQLATRTAGNVRTAQSRRVAFTPPPRTVSAAEALRRETETYPSPQPAPARPGRGPSAPRPQQPAARRASPYL